MFSLMIHIEQIKYTFVLAVEFPSIQLCFAVSFLQSAK